MEIGKVMSSILLDLKEFILIVSREFYYFWTGGVQKENYIEQGNLIVDFHDV